METVVESREANVIAESLAAISDNRLLTTWNILKKSSEV